MRITLGQTILAPIVMVAWSSATVSGDSSLISLADSLEPLKNGFNADATKPRVVAILSPT